MTNTCTRTSEVDKTVNALLEVLEREEDILETEWIQRESLPRLTDLTQSFGRPMGSPLSPLLENMYMDKLEREFEKSPLQPRMLMQYLDDYFALLSHAKNCIKVLLKEKKTLFASLPTQHEKTDKMDCSGVYRIKCGTCEQKYIGRTGRKTAYESSKIQNSPKNMDTEETEIAEHIARTEHEIDCKSAERLAAYGENTRKRKIREAIEILTERSLLKRRLEEGRISENIANCLNKLREYQTT
ncbi:unnamed protein product, partial [Protopolystoma xenopodis]